MQFIAFQTISSTEARKQIVKEGNFVSSSNEEAAFGWLVNQNISYLIPCGLLLGIIQGHDYKRL